MTSPVMRFIWLLSADLLRKRCKEIDLQETAFLYDIGTDENTNLQKRLLPNRACR
jgi:hypothetical protein